MSSARYLPKRDYLALKGPFRRLIIKVGGGNEAAALTRVGQQALDRYGSANDEHDERFAPIDVVADLEAACGDPIITRKLAELAGHVLLPLPKVGPASGKIDLMTARAVAKFGEMLTELAEAKADGVFTAQEARDLRPDVAELLTMLVKLDREFMAVANGGEDP